MYACLPENYEIIYCGDNIYRLCMKLIIIDMLFDITSSFVNENNGYSLIGCNIRQVHHIRSEIANTRYLNALQSRD